MISLDHIKDYSLSKPNGWSIFGSAEDFAQLPAQHQNQILFLNQDANTYLYQYFEASKLVTGPNWNPFAKRNFKVVEEFTNLDDDQQLKKWLYRRGIPFKNLVFLLPFHSEEPVYLTWKMVIKYSFNIFWRQSDVVLFDQSNNWCLFYFHEEHLFFGRENMFDPEIGYQYTNALYEMKKKYSNFRNPILPE